MIPYCSSHCAHFALFRTPTLNITHYLKIYLTLYYHVRRQHLWRFIIFDVDIPDPSPQLSFPSQTSFDLSVKHFPFLHRKPVRHSPLAWQALGDSSLPSETKANYKIKVWRNLKGIELLCQYNFLTAFGFVIYQDSSLTISHYL